MEKKPSILLVTVTKHLLPIIRKTKISQTIHHKKSRTVLEKIILIEFPSLLYLHSCLKSRDPWPFNLWDNYRDRATICSGPFTDFSWKRKNFFCFYCIWTWIYQYRYSPINVFRGPRISVKMFVCLMSSINLLVNNSDWLYLFSLFDLCGFVQTYAMRPKSRSSSIKNCLLVSKMQPKND